MTALSEVELLQRYRRDRRDLLSFLLSSSLLKKVVMPPGAVAFEDIDLDLVSVQHVLDCARKGGILEVADAIKRYHDDLSLPPAAGTGLDEVFFLVTNPASSGPAPTRPPPPIAIPALSSPSASKFTLRSATPRQPSIEDVEEFEDAEDDVEFSTEITRRQVADTGEVVLGLPAFATNLSDDDLRETAYEVLLVSVGAAGGLVVPPKDKQEKKSKLARRFTRSKSEKAKPPPSPATGLAGLMDTMRTQMEISEADDWRTREGLLNASSGRVGKRMDTLLVPLELLSSVPQTKFSDRKAYLRWQKRQLSILEEGLLYLPAVRLEHLDPRALELRAMIARLEEAENLPPPAGPAQSTVALRAMRGVALALSERAGPVDQPGEVCHWADGYHLNVRIYEKLLGSVFDILEESRVVDEVEEILELLKSTWRLLGITPIVHNTVYTWVLFRQFILTGEESLLKLTAAQAKKIGSDAQCSMQEREYLRTLRSSVDGIDVPEELTYLQSYLGPIKEWTDKRLSDYHSNFSEGSKRMECVVTLAMIAESAMVVKSHGMTRMPTSTDPAVIAKNYIESSLTLAYERIVEMLDKSSEGQEVAEHPLATLAERVESLAKTEAFTYSQVFSVWNPQAIVIAGSLLHRLYGQELRPFQDGVSQFSEDVASVLSAADSLESYLLDLVDTVSEEGKDNVYMKQLEPYHVEVLSEMLCERWVSSQLTTFSEWVERSYQQEKWEPVSEQARYSRSIVEVFRIIDETTDQFFNLKLPVRFPILKALATGFNRDLLLYVNKIPAELGDKADLIPPAPTLTRYKRDMAVKATSKKKVVDPRLPDQQRTDEINRLTIVTLCVRLNTLNFIDTQLDSLQDSIRTRWAKARPQDPLSQANGDDWKLKRASSGPGSMKPSDELSVIFESTRKAVSAGTERLCDFTGTKIIFWDIRDTIIEGLYKVSVAQARMVKVTNELDPVLGQLCEMIDDPLRDRLVLGLLHAALEGLLRVLLDGGPTRAFAQSDSDMLEEDLNMLKEFFIADGDGLPRSVVNNAAAPVQQILNLYTLETSIVIDSFKRSSEQMVSGGSGNMQRTGPPVATDSDTLLRVLCHRLDREASKFLKKHYNLPKV